MQVIYGFPTRDLKVIGVTGTNGKTTTAFMIHKMMVQAGYSVGLMTTVGWGVGDQITPQIEHMTTMSSGPLLKRIKKLKSQGAKWLVLEVTSHALGQNRVWGINYDIAVMTNVTHEHLDYHGTFENYLLAKLKLFEKTAKNRGGMQIGVINGDDKAAERFTNITPKNVTYGIKKGELKAVDISATPAGSSFHTRYQGKSMEALSMAIKTPLPGSFNVYNALAAASVGLALSLHPQQIEQGIASLKAVEGRMNRIDEGQDFDVIIDYAHTPDSFEKLFADLKPVVKGRLIAMFGSAGRRDVAKRAVQGEIAGKYADEVILTEEDDRDVDGELILKQIAEGAKKAGKKLDRTLFLIHDRAKAIEFTLDRAKKGDTVLLLGKGHEKNIERAEGLIEWDEATVTRQVLRKLEG
jgi:UDP-N-acetylmuramoyl-L-alanyl-D-glutamate--2,6-diaminopimelate ligase